MALLSNGFAKGILGAAIMSLTFAAVAYGRDLLGKDGMGSLDADTSATINRTAKADRGALAGKSELQTLTVALRLDDLTNTSVLIRVPAARATGSAPPSRFKSGDSKPTIACEPSVSVLTEVAKRLQPGRCVT